MHPEQQRQAALVDALRDPARYPHPAERVELIETHISYVLLAGDYAYKLKKAVDLGFLDFSTLDKRHHYCDEELRLNGRLAPDVYLAVVAFTGSAQAPVFDGDGTPFEYAVKMRRFAQADLLSERIADHALPVERIDEMADRVARFHLAIPAVDADAGLGDPDAIIAPMRENFRQIEPLLDEPDQLKQLVHITDWTEARFEALKPVIAKRKVRGKVRECHGDMHLANMAIYRGRLEIFDGIEFNPSLRWIDVMSEIAFLTMDLVDRGAPEWSYRLLDRYLQHTGDYHGLVLLRFYQVYRAMVRAKVAVIRLQQEGMATEERTEILQTYREYAGLAERYTHPGRPALLITHGFSGSGKTTLSGPILEALEAVRLRSDIERKRLAGMAPTERGDAAPDTGLYSRESSERTYATLADTAGDVIGAGFPVIVDATFLERERRDRFARLADRLGVPFLILDLQAPLEVLRERIRTRAEGDADASDADLSILEHQLTHHDPLSRDEPVMAVDSTRPFDPGAIERRLFG